jgi:protein-S-isoprenylcysteine O-methyltransferase Ste14
VFSPSTAQPQTTQQDPDSVSRIGGWLFKHRSALPLPLVLVLLLVPAPRTGVGAWPGWVAAGLALVVLGELLRFWGVHHIGTISRTRSDRLGPLIDTGPFAAVRNPLYLGNILLWLGFSISARLLWLAPLVVGLLALEYHAIVRWEERLLESRLGESYRQYLKRVPRWIPKLPASLSAGEGAAFAWKDTLFSERSTLIAIAAGYALLALKSALA